MERFYFDNMTPIHSEKLSIENQCLVIISVIKEFYLFLFKTIIGFRKKDVRSVTIKYICCDKNTTFQHRVAQNNHLHW